MANQVGRAGLRALAVSLSLAVLASGCGSDVDDTEYSETNREAFLVACTDVGQDTRLVRDICECTYDKIEIDLDFDELVDTEESLRLDALRPLPDPIAGFMADCFLAEVDL